MHAVRRQAHRAASSGSKTNYNPFARARALEDAPWGDEENIYRTRSETGQMAAIEEQRRIDLDRQGAAKEFGGPLHHVTEPVPKPVKRQTVHEDIPPVQKGRSGIVIASSSGFILYVALKILEIWGVFKSWDLLRKARDNRYDIGIWYEERNLSIEDRKLRALQRKISMGRQCRNVMFGSWAMMLSPCVPVGFALRYANVNAVAVFCVNFIAIVPCANALSTAVDQISIRATDYVGVLLNMTFGNAVQLIVSILLLKSRQVSVLKLSLLGAILSNLLLTSGLSFLLGGYYHFKQFFDKSFAQTISMFLLLAVTSLIVPSAAHLMTDTSAQGIRAQSRGISVVILVSYVLWLFYQLKTHKSEFEAQSLKALEWTPSLLQEGSADRGMAAIGAGAAAASGGGVNLKNLLTNRDKDEEEEREEEVAYPRLSWTGSILTLMASVVLVAFVTEFATDSIQAVLRRQKVSQTFLSLIILPLLSIDPMAIAVAMQDKMNMSISLALERCMQTCLMLVPLTVLLAWCMGVNEMNLEFEGFAIASLFASIIIVTYVVQEGESNWLTGALLIKVFIIVALSAFYMH